MWMANRKSNKPKSKKATAHKYAKLVNHRGFENVVLMKNNKCSLVRSYIFRKTIATIDKDYKVLEYKAQLHRIRALALVILFVLSGGPVGLLPFAIFMMIARGYVGDFGRGDLIYEVKEILEKPEDWRKNCC